MPPKQTPQARRGRTRSLSVPRQSTSARSISEMSQTQKALERKVLQLTKELKSSKMELQTSLSKGDGEVSSHGSETMSAPPTDSEGDYMTPAQRRQAKKRSLSPETAETAGRLDKGKKVAGKRKATAEPEDWLSQDEVSSDEESDSPATRTRQAVKKLLQAAGLLLTNKKGKKKCYPYSFIKRGRRFDSIGPGEASWPEYLSALKQMVRMPECPEEWIPFIPPHEEQLVNMAKIWDWQTCRHWSESVFMMVNDGSLRRGWRESRAIRDLQKDITETGRKVVSYRDQQKQEVVKKYSYTKPDTTQAGDQMQRYIATDGRQQYEKEKDGKPCYPWNWGRECGFTGLHGSFPEVKPHICAYCAYKTKKVLDHREKDCVNKMRAVERAQTGTTSKDFQ